MLPRPFQSPVFFKTFPQYLVAAWIVCLGGRMAIAAEPGSLLRQSGISGGVVVHLGCGDAGQTAGMLLSDRFLVHGLASSAEQVQRARRNLQSLGHYGRISVAQFDGRHLPYADDLINFLVDTSEKSVADDEILRVLVPGGVAWRGARKIEKPWPSDIDEWTHFLHGADNNAVARDRRVGIPRSMQWVSEPKWGRTHEEMASMSAAVTARGRIFYIVDEAPLASIRFSSQWKLVARDAFNGMLLWKQTLKSWVDPLRHFRSGPVHLPRRLVAVGDKVYCTLGLDQPVVVLDGATGKLLREYRGTEGTEEILVSDGVAYLVVGSSETLRRGGGLYRRGEPPPSDFRYVTALESATGKTLWKRDFTDEYILPLTLAIKKQRVYCQTSVGIRCFDARTGGDIWKTARVTPAQRMAFSAPTLVATDEVLLCADRDLGKGAEGEPLTGAVQWGVHGWNEPGFARKTKNTLRAYAAHSGRELWSTDCSEGYNSPVDVFVIGDTVWVGTAFQGLDLKTGELKQPIDTRGPRVGMSHPRCYRNKASERFIFTGKSGIEVLSLETGWLSNNSWVRGTCQYGIVPANGLLYAPPDACACFLTVKSPGFIAVAPKQEPVDDLPLPEARRLEKGPGFDAGPAHSAPFEVSATDWPMYRHDAGRTSTATCSLPQRPVQQWTAELGGKLTQPVVAGGSVFVAATDEHTVYALDERDGREIWRFTAGGAIDSPPTVYRDSVLMGSADGWIYCLAATDGRLRWRFLAAPRERLVSVYGQLESAWPVHGAVLVQNDHLYATAGRSTYLDGGIVLYRLDPASGKQLSRSELCHLDPETDQQLVPEARFNMEGTTSDVLTGDGERVYLKYFGFDRSCQPVEQSEPHLFSITGLLGEEWFVRSYWIVGQGMPTAGWGGWAGAANAFPSGRILCFTDDCVYGYGRREVTAGAVGHRADEYHLFKFDRHAKPVQPNTAKPKDARRKGRAKPRKPTKPSPMWSEPGSLIVRAMVLGPNVLAVAGAIDERTKDPDLLVYRNPPEALASFQGQRGANLRIVATSDGRQLAEIPLGAMPVFDGMAAAGGKIFASLKNGTLVCLGESR